MNTVSALIQFKHSIFSKMTFFGALNSNLAQKCVFYGNFNKVRSQFKPSSVLEQIPVHHSILLIFQKCQDEVHNRKM